MEGFKSGMSIPKDRIISATLMSALAIAGIFNSWAFILVILALTMGGLYEFFYLIKKKDIPIYSYTGIIIGMIILFLSIKMVRAQNITGQQLPIRVNRWLMHRLIIVIRIHFSKS